MFEKSKHRRNPGLCLNHPAWRGNFLECAVCDAVIATFFDGELCVAERYSSHEDKIHAYARANPNTKEKKQPDAWCKATSVVDEIRKQTSAIKKSNEQRRVEHPEWYDEDGDPIALEFDGEDSAAGDFYLGGDAEEPETIN